MVEQESLQYTRDLYYGKQKMERNIRDNPWVSWVSEFSSSLVSHKLGFPGFLSFAFPALAQTWNSWVYL